MSDPNLQATLITLAVLGALCLAFGWRRVVAVLIAGLVGFVSMDVFLTRDLHATAAAISTKSNPEHVVLFVQLLAVGCLVAAWGMWREGQRKARRRDE